MKFQKLLLSCALLFSVIFSTAQEQAYYPDPNPAIQKRLIWDMISTIQKVENQFAVFRISD